MRTVPELDLIDSAWDDVLTWLPRDLDAMAKEAFGFRRRGLIQSASDVLRLALAYSVLDFSLRSSAAWLITRGLGDISDVAVLGRLRRSQPFFAQVLARLLTTRLQFAPGIEFKYRVRLIDATCVSQPGSTGPDWRINLVARGVVDNIELTDGTGGENLGRAAVCEGDLVLGDRGYAHASRMLGTAACGGEGPPPAAARGVRTIVIAKREFSGGGNGQTPRLRRVDDRDRPDP